MLRKISTILNFYYDLTLMITATLLNKTNFHWKVSNYADSYWFMFNAKVSNHEQTNYINR